eukprot:COSAG06_NODE_2623_length_6562_cov_9.546031_6_plen_106_part_00
MAALTNRPVAMVCGTSCSCQMLAPRKDTSSRSLSSAANTMLGRTQTIPTAIILVTVVLSGSNTAPEATEVSAAPNERPNQPAAVPVAAVSLKYGRKPCVAAAGAA